MANSGSNKFPISKNIIYDSGNDTSTGRKRAVDLGGGVSVAERARLFGGQVTLPSAAKNSKPQRPPIKNQPPPIRNQSPPRNTQPSPIDNQPTKSNIVHQDRNYQPYKRDINRNPKYDTAYVPPQIVPNYSRPPVVQFNDKQIREQPRNYSTVTRPQNQQQQSSTFQRPVSGYDTFQRSTSQQQTPRKINPTQIIPGESYTSDRNPYFDSYEKQKSASPVRNLNYFQPIQDPLEALYKSSTQGYYQTQQQQIPKSISTNMSGVQPFDLGNLIGRIQEDYLNNVRPYVSSVEFIESELNLANIGLITPSNTRKDYMRRSDDMYNQEGTKYYDVIDPNNSLYPTYSRQLYNDNNNYSSMKRRKHRKRYHDQASSPIPMLQSSDTKNQQPESPKAPTPIAETESEEEPTTATNTLADASKTTEPETSSESEDESSEHPVTTPATQPNQTTRPPLPVQTPPTAAVRTPAKPVESESSESEESNSDSDSETDDDEDEKPKPKPSPATQVNTRGTPQTNTRGTPQTNTRGTPQTNTRGTPQTNTRETPQTNARDAPQPTSINNSSKNQPPEYSSSVNNFDLQNSGKSSGVGGRFKSITNKFRRKKS